MPAVKLGTVETHGRSGVKLSPRCLEVVPFERAVDFVDYLRPTQVHWGDSVAVSWIYRGQADASWGLLPRVWRETGLKILEPLRLDFEEFLENEGISLFDAAVRKWGIKGKKNFLQSVSQAAAEHEAVRQFALLADELGIRVIGHADVLSGRAFMDTLASEDRWPE